MVLDLGSLREGPVAYLGWYLEGEAIGRGWPTYRCHASEDLGSNVFQVTVVAGSMPGDREARFRAAKDASFALAKGKVFLGTWQHQQDYNVKLPLAQGRLPTQEIRERILRGLFRLYENDFAEDRFQVDLDGVASELGVTRSAVDRAVDWLYDAALIKDHGTLGKHRGTGHFWLSSAGAAHVEERLPSRLNTVGAAPMTSERDTSFATDRKRVAVVHGRDTRPKDAMFNFLLALRLNPIEWTQAIAATRKATPYNKEAVAELFKDTQAVVVLMTGDDDAQLREQFRRASDEAFESELTPQPRPNVLIELGMALGIMDERTIIVELGRVRPISDLLGLNFIRLSKDAAARKGLVERLKGAGCDLDDSGVDWLTAGDFTPTPPKRPRRTAKQPVPPTEEALKRQNEELKARLAAREEAQKPRFALHAIAEEKGAALRVVNEGRGEIRQCYARLVSAVVEEGAEGTVAEIAAGRGKRTFKPAFENQGIEFDWRGGGHGALRKSFLTDAVVNVASIIIAPIVGPFNIVDVVKAQRDPVTAMTLRSRHIAPNREYQLEIEVGARNAPALRRRFRLQIVSHDDGNIIFEPLSDAEWEASHAGPSNTRDVRPKPVS